VAKLNHSLNVPIKVISQIKSTQLRRLLMKPMRRCSSRWNASNIVSTPLYLLLNPTLMAFVQGDIPMSFKNVGFSSAKSQKFVHYPLSVQIRMIMVWYCIVFVFFSVCLHWL